MNVQQPLAHADRENVHTTSALAASIGNTEGTKKLRIALLGYRSHPFVGGQGIYIKYLSRALKQLGHTVHVYSGQPYPEIDANIQLIRVPSLDLYAQKSHVKALRLRHLCSFSNFFEWWTMLTGGFAEPYTFGRRVRKILSKTKYDIIHDNQSLSYALLNLQKNGHTVVSTIHHPIHRDRELALQAAPDWAYRVLVKRWHSFLTMQERVVNKLRHVVTVSEQSQKDIQRYFKREKAQVIFNGVDVDVFRPLASIEETPFTLLTTSSSDQPLKGMKYLIEALAKLKLEFPDIQLRVIGEFKKDGDNAKRIKKYNLEKHVGFISGISNKALVEAYNAATIVVCPSLYEGFGLPAAEALACGKAIVSSDGGALPEVVGNAGLIVPKANSEALYSAIHQLLNDAEKRNTLASLARDRALKHFCWKRVATELTAYYHTCLDEKKS